jgi:hypothetical protein
MQEQSTHSMGGSVNSEHIEAWSTHRQLSMTTTRGHMDSPADFLAELCKPQKPPGFNFNPEVQNDLPPQ